MSQEIKLDHELQSHAFNSVVWAVERVQASWQEAAEQHTRPSVLYRPKLYKDGNQWCALLEDNIQEGLCAFGDTPEDSMLAFDSAWSKP